MSVCLSVCPLIEFFAVEGQVWLLQPRIGEKHGHLLCFVCCGVDRFHSLLWIADVAEGRSQTVEVLSTGIHGTQLVSFDKQVRHHTG